MIKCFICNLMSAVVILAWNMFLLFLVRCIQYLYMYDEIEKEDGVHLIE